jgi:hypothetical protein
MGCKIGAEEPLVTRLPPAIGLIVVPRAPLYANRWFRFGMPSPSAQRVGASPVSI